MRKSSEYDVKMPEYAMCYLINGDSSGNEEADIKIIDTYMRKFYDEAKKTDGHVVVGMPEDGHEPYFTSMPAFGLACTVYDIRITVFN